MSKGNNKRGNKEIKKPKQERPKASVTPVAGETKSLLNLAGKKVKSVAARVDATCASPLGAIVLSLNFCFWKECNAGDLLPKKLGRPI